MVKNLPATQEPQEMWARSLGQKDPLEEGTETHATILTWRIPWTWGPRIPTVHRVTVSDTTEATQHLVHTHTHTHTHIFIGQHCFDESFH